MRPTITLTTSPDREHDGRGNMEWTERDCVRFEYPDGTSHETWRNCLSPWEFGDMTDEEIRAALAQQEG